MVSGIISYDITIDYYRNRLNKLLIKYGVRIQHSVFQFSLDKKIYSNLLSDINIFYREYNNYLKKHKHLTPTSNSILIYPLCTKCLSKEIVLGSKLATEEEITRTVFII